MGSRKHRSMPEPRQKVKVVFKNGTLIEGVVLEWDDKIGKIYTNTGSVIEIYNIPENVLFVKVLNPMLDRDPELEEYIEGHTCENETHEMETVEPEEVHEQDPRLRAASLADLRVKKNKQLREIVAERLRSRNIQSNIQVGYESPDFTKSSAVKHPPEKNNYSS